MRSKAIFVALLALALGGVEAATVSSELAKTAVRGWVARRDTFGVRLGSTVRDVRTLTMTNGVRYHAVRLLGGGTVITSGETSDEPIVAFTQATNDLSRLDPRSPLWALLDRAANQKKSTREFAAAASAEPLVTKAAAAGQRVASLGTRSAQKWRELVAEGSDTSATAVLAASPALAGSDTWVIEPYTASTISDVRVDPLVKTKWSQGTAPDQLGGFACYNYYTPCGLDQFNDGDPFNIVCGCVATAMAQVMRYFEFPQEEVEAKTQTCFWSDEPMQMTMKGGVYDWSKMVETPDGSTDESCRQEIGKLTYDAGVAVKMNYNMLNKETGAPTLMSGAYSYDVRGALIDTFGYSSATFFSDTQYLLTRTTLNPEEFDERRAEALQRSFYANLDAGLPVIVGLTDHEVVADGYGYSADGLDYLHLNMGWEGNDDYWFLMPVVSYKNGGQGVLDPTGTMYFNDVTYNVFTNATDECAVLSGRVLDDEGEPATDAVVSVFLAGTPDVVATATPNEHGVWGVIVPAGTYDLDARDGRLIGLVEDVTVTLPVTRNITWNGLTTVPSVMPKEPEEIGNSWGNDITVSSPAVEVNGREFSTLDRALAYAATNDNAVVRILQEVELRRPFTITNTCTITATNPVATASEIFPAAGALLTLAAGADVTFTHAAFHHDDGLTLVAQAGSVLRVSEVAELGEIRVADADNLCLAGALASAIVVDAPFAAANGQTFARVDPYTPEAAATAWYLLNKYDEESVGECYDAGAGYKLRWKPYAEVPPAVAHVRYDDGTEHYYRSLSVFLKYHSNGGTAEILKDTTMTNDVVIANAAIVLCGAAAGPVTVTPSSDARLTVAEGGSLVISNLIVSGYAGNTHLFKVSGGGMTLEEGAVLDDLVRSLSVADEEPGGATFLDWGTFTMRPGSAIRRCRATGNCLVTDPFGGGLYAWGGTLNLLGGEITDCSALRGGGVYAEMIYGDLDVNLAGDLRVSGNLQVDENGERTDNLCVDGLDWQDGVTVHRPTVVGALSQTRAIGIGYDASAPGNKAGEPFAEVDASLTEPEAAASAGAFSNDVYLKLRSAADAGAGTLVWTESTVGPEEAVALTVYGEGTDDPTTNYFDSVAAAFGSLTNDATVVVETNLVELLEDITIPPYEVVFRSAVAEPQPSVIGRVSDVCFTVGAGASLIVSNLSFTCYGQDKLALYEESGGKTALDRNPLFNVDGGALTLGVGATVDDLVGDETSEGSPSACAVYVVNNGRFRLEEGAAISSCANYYDGTTVGVAKDADAGLAGGVVLAGGTAYLTGGVISNCFAMKGGAVFVGNDSVAHVSGSFQAVDNGCWKDSTVLPNARDANVTYDGNGLLCLDGVYGGSAGVGCGWDVSLPGSSNVFGFVEYDGDLGALVASARRFYKDLDWSDTGAIVTNDAQALLVWSSAVRDGVYVDENGVRYGVVQGPVSAMMMMSDAKSGGSGGARSSSTEESASEPTPVAFKSVSRLSETDWVFVVTDCVVSCRYRLLSTSDLSKGFTTTGEWYQAVSAGEWTTNVTTTVGQHFWKVEATGAPTSKE